MQRQKWEYAYIIWYKGGDEGSHWLNLIHLHPSGRKTELVQKKGLLSKAPNWTEQFQAWVTQLGEEAYEMVGVMATEGMGGAWTTQHYWFKRPFV
jgi:hypothetical protein